MALTKAQITDPVLPKETVDVPEMGGEVIVQALMLEERLQLAAADLPAFGHVAELLARSVVDDNGERIWSADKWRVFGGQHYQAAWKLFEVAQRLSKLEKPDEKNAQTPS
jgi:hypothetical protein